LNYFPVDPSLWLAVRDPLGREPRTLVLD
jgi:hypothetical protein